MTKIAKGGPTSGRGVVWHQRFHIAFAKIGFNEGRFKPCMHARCARVAIRIVALCPAVVVDAGVQWLRAIADIMAEPADVKENSLLNTIGIFMRRQSCAVVAHVGLQALVDFRGLPGKKSNVLRQKLCCYGWNLLLKPEGCDIGIAKKFKAIRW